MSEPSTSRCPAGVGDNHYITTEQRGDTLVKACSYCGRPEAELRAELDARASSTRPCPYCMEQISALATRCKHCSGQLHFCDNCGGPQGVNSEQKFVGILRGVNRTKNRCMVCSETV